MLHDQGLSIDDYVLFPVHPWQYQHFCRTSLRKRLGKNWFVPLPLKFEIIYRLQVCVH